LKDGVNFDLGDEGMKVLVFWKLKYISFESKKAKKSKK